MKAKQTPERERRVKRETVRERVLEAANAMFAEEGFAAASLDRVAEAAGFSKGAVYSNFANKDELLLALVMEKIDARIKLIESRLAMLWAKGGAPKGMDLSLAAGRELRALGAADPAWQILFLEFWLRCARNEELRKRLSEKRNAMRGAIAKSVQAMASVAGIALNNEEALNMATAVLALSNGLGIEGIIDSKSVPQDLLGELLSGYWETLVKRADRT
jgi:AcrR family transcriptional regulator